MTVNQILSPGQPILHQSQVILTSLKTYPKISFSDIYVISLLIFEISIVILHISVHRQRYPNVRIFLKENSRELKIKSRELKINDEPENVRPQGDLRRNRDKSRYSKDTQR
jgi:hypothetical protein